MKKRILIVFMAALIVLMCGCGSSNDDITSVEPIENQALEENTEESDKIVISMSYWNSEDTVRALLDYLAVKVPNVEIEYHYVENNDYDSVIAAQLSYGKASDIICVSPGIAIMHARNGYLEPLDKLAYEYSTAGTNIYKYENQVYALPGISWFEGIWYNKSIFEENEIELPKTFDEYIAVCKQFQELGITPLIAGLQSWEPMLKNSMAFVSAEFLSTDEGRNFGEDYRNGLTTLDGVWNPYLEKWSEMITEGIYSEDMLGLEHGKALEQFANGEAAMFCSGPWDYDAIMSVNPDLKLDMMPFYGTKESAGWLIGGPGCGFALNADSKHKEAATEVLRTISTYEGQAALWENNKGGSSYLEGAVFELPECYASVADTLAAGNVYCPWNEWGVAAVAHEEYGNEMLIYFLGAQDLSTTLQHVDLVVSELSAN